MSDYTWPYFAQEPPMEPVVRMLCDEDVSMPYEMDQTAVFLTEAGNILVVHVEGCSCFPQMGGTDQNIYRDKTSLFKALSPTLRDKLQSIIMDTKFKRGG
jgi:hypothetical protein